MFIPVGEDTQSVWQVDKDEHGNVTKKQLFGVMVGVRILSAAAPCL
jgi:protein-L-isoaspartate(D-aspartate) O-methyltransferase